jgi:8-oxo-dGTP pyrophosphatase MutT (NUDIX family)
MLPPPFDRIRAILAQRPVGQITELPPELFPVKRAASVLVPLFLRGGAPFLVLTQRTEHLALHAGQISFPGGGHDEGDRDELATALREAEEEIGLDPSAAEVLGPLDRLDTVTGFRVSPFVAAIPEGYAYRPQAEEVAAILELPLAAFLEPGALQTEEREVFGALRRIYGYTVQGHLVWGATGRIVKNLLEAIGPAL